MTHRPHKSNGASCRQHRSLACTIACAFFLSLFQSFANAAGIAPFPPGSGLRFRHITLADGLAQSSAQAITQDHQGYMWIGTEDGLQRYDGYEFLTFHHDPGKPDSLADDDIAALAVGRKDELWIGTAGQGLDLLEPGSRHFVHYRHENRNPESLVSDVVLTLLMDRSGQLWIGTADGLDRMDGLNGHFHHYRIGKSGNATNVIFSLYQDTHGRIWVGTARGLYFYDAARDALQAFKPAAGVSPKKVQHLLTKASVNAFTESNDRQLWVATEGGLVVLSPQGRPIKLYQHRKGDMNSLPSSRVRALLEDAAGDIWIGTYGGGVARLDRSSGRFFVYQHDATDPQSLGDDNILTLFRDQTGLVWVGTAAAGISLYNPQTREFGYYRHRQGNANSLASNMVWDIYKDPHGVVWVATDQGLTRMDAPRIHYRQYQLQGRPKQLEDDAAVYELYGDREGRLWAGTDYGIYEYQAAQDRFRQFHLIGKHDDKAGDSVNIAYEDTAHRFWIGTGHGLAEFDRKTHKVTKRFVHDAKRADSLPDDNVVAICETENGNLWLATVNGLARFDGIHDHFTVYKKLPGNPHSLSSNNIQSCSPGMNSILWVGTASGLNKLDTKTGTVTRYSTANGLPNNTIYAILRDHQGDLWISTDKGLSRFDPNANTFRNYGVTDGLQSLEFNGESAYAAPDGELFFGGINGLNAFYPERIDRNQHVPRIAITAFNHAGRITPLLTEKGPVKAVTVPYSDNVLSFSLAAFDYAAPLRNQFKFRLEGFENDWHVLHGQHSFTYTNLDPGAYQLEVMGSNSDGVWNKHATTLILTIQPPPWRTWWAYTLYTALLFVIIVIALKLFARSIRREQILTSEHQKRMWAETLHNLIQSVMTLRDERAIAEQLIDVLVNVSEYERVLFYMEDSDGFHLLASRGVEKNELEQLQRWPEQQARTLLTLRQGKIPRLLAPSDTAALDGTGNSQRNYLAVPLSSGTTGFRLLLAARTQPAIEQQSVDIAAAMTKQVSVALDNAQLIHELENLATTDSLTHLYNRRHFLERATAEFERSQRYQRPLSVFLIDADHFKEVNDRHGHETGDQVLRLVASACRKNLRQLDVIGRYGGEEFAVFLPETSIAKAMEVAERLRAGVEHISLELPSGKVQITISIGVATATTHTDSIAALINEADRALYEAKRTGRNRIKLSRSDLDSNI